MENDTIERKKRRYTLLKQNEMEALGNILYDVSYFLRIVQYLSALLLILSTVKISHREITIFKLIFFEF